MFLHRNLDYFQLLYSEDWGSERSITEVWAQVLVG